MVGVALVVESVAILAERGEFALGAWGLGAAAVVSGSALVAGVLTPAAGALAALVNVAAVVLFPGLGPPWAFQGSPTNLLLLAMATAIVLLGPGGFSVDARLFGWREIVLPRSSDPASGDDPGGAR